MRIAIIGAGISGLVVAYLLHKKHEVTVFEAQGYIGGHTNTIDVEEANGTVAVDTGFIVFNTHNYPNFCKILDQIGVESQTSDMSFSVRDLAAGLEYAGGSWNGLFAQRRNLLRPSFLRMVSEILRFYREAQEQRPSIDPDMTLGAFLKKGGYSEAFVEQHIVPMGAAIWSAGLQSMRDFPVGFFIDFFANHGMLQVKDRPRWRTIRGGSRQYIGPLTAGFRDRIHLQTPIRSIQRFENSVEVTPVSAAPAQFDHVVLACHSDQSLRMLQDPSDEERRVLGELPYQANDTVLHTDDSVLPHNRRAWASWNFDVDRTYTDRVTMTYYINRLQQLRSTRNYCVTLNRSEHIDTSRVIQRIDYEHPVYTVPGVTARAQHQYISGIRNTHYCGAYWGSGFHEDGVNSALEVCKHFGVTL